MKNVQGIEELITKGLIETAETILEDVKDSQTIPFDSGVLQNDSTYVDFSKAQQGEVRIVSDTPYARRLYFHPEYKFNQEHNPNAGGGWFEPYISGGKKDMAQERFESYIKSRVGG